MNGRTYGSARKNRGDTSEEMMMRGGGGGGAL